MSRWAKRGLLIVGGVVACLVGFRLLIAFSSRPGPLPLTVEQLADVPDTPNCVSSQVASNHPAWIAPLDVDDRRRPVEQLAFIVRQLPGATIIQQSDDMLVCEFRTPWFKFVDDADFMLDRENRQIAVRSASRIGYSDLGANRARVERIRGLWNSAPQ